MGLKIRYALIFTSFFAVLLTVFSSLVYIQVRNRLVGGAEQILINHLEHESRHLDHPHGPSHSPTPISHHRDIFQRVWKNGALIDDSFPEKLKAIPAQDIESNEKRLVRRIQVRQGAEVYELVVYYDLNSTLEYLAALRKILLLGCLFSLALIVPMSLWLMRVVLRPFGSLSETAKSITAQDLSFRFPETKQTDEFGGLVRSFNLLFDRLESSFNQISRFATNVSHELRTPLAVIIGQAERVRRRPRDVVEYEAVIDKILFRAKSLKGITHRLLTLAEIERAEQQSQFNPISAVASIKEVVDSLLFARSGVKKDVKIVAQGEIKISASEELFLCLVNNLIENAIKYSRDNVLISAGLRDGKFYLEVGDDGPGIAASEREKVFEPFYKTTAGTSKGEGHGLGLSIAKACVEALGGSIALGESSLGGLAVRVSLQNASN